MYQCLRQNSSGHFIDLEDGWNKSKCACAFLMFSFIQWID